MIQAMTVIPNENDATSFYRGGDVLAALRKQMDGAVTWLTYGAVNRRQIRDCDFIFMQRPFSNEHFELVKRAQEWGIPIWVDYDDLLFDVPRDNPAYGLYMTRNARATIAEIINRATLVTVSTNQLKRCIQNVGTCLNEFVYVIPNALDDALLKYAKPLSFRKELNWRGTNTHQRDLMCYGEQVLNLARRHKDLKLTYLGYNPWLISQYLPDEQVVVVDPMPIDAYVEFLSRLNPCMTYVPLHESMFNKCKSNIAWIEATLAGSVCFAPDWEEWRRPGVFTFKDPAQFERWVENAIAEPEMLAQARQASMQYIQQNLLLSQVNHKRKQIVLYLTKLGRGKDAVPPEGGEKDVFLRA